MPLASPAIIHLSRLSSVKKAHPGMDSLHEKGWRYKLVVIQCSWSLEMKKKLACCLCRFSLGALGRGTRDTHVHTQCLTSHLLFLWPLVSLSCLDLLLSCLFFLWKWQLPHCQRFLYIRLFSLTKGLDGWQHSRERGSVLRVIILWTSSVATAVSPGVNAEPYSVSFCLKFKKPSSERAFAHNLLRGAFEKQELAKQTQ